MNIVCRCMGILAFAFGLAACGGSSSDPEPPPPAEVNTVVDVAIDNGNFTNLVEALQAAGLDSTLANENKTFTVFAPTDTAFDKIDDATLNALFANLPALT